LELSIEAAMGIRQMNPSVAWNEAERRAIPAGLVGFFAGGLICELSGELFTVREPFLAGLCGAVGLFASSLAFLIGFYHKRVVLAAVAAIVFSVLPTMATGLLLPWIGTGLARLAPCAVLGTAAYAILHRLNQRHSGLGPRQYLELIAEDKHKILGSRWRTTVFWLCVGVGAIVVLRLLSR
jgi:hypothetical protein